MTTCKVLVTTALLIVAANCASALEQIDRTASKDLNINGFTDECYLKDADASESCSQYIEYVTNLITYLMKDYLHRIKFF